VRGGGAMGEGRCSENIELMRAKNKHVDLELNRFFSNGYKNAR
jgi:hypothetical protein